MLNLMVLFVFSVLKRKYLSWAYLVQKNYEQYEIFFGPEIPSFGRTWSTKSKLPVQDEIDFPELDGNVHFFYFGPETPFMGITGRKKIRIVSNFIKYIELDDEAHFSVLDWKYHFLGKFSPSNQTFLFNMKFCT